MPPRTRRNHVSGLIELLRYPSVSAQPDHADDVICCARWLKGASSRIGLEHAQLVRTRAPPHHLRRLAGRRRKPTVLIYGHYDVQPPDPIRQWHTDPFEPAVRDNDLYARGASDDKGQLFIHLAAIEAYLKTSGKLPVNVKILLEGEEEIGSPNLAAFLGRNRLSLAADAALISDLECSAPTSRRSPMACAANSRSKSPFAEPATTFIQEISAETVPDPLRGAGKDHRPASRYKGQDHDCRTSTLMSDPSRRRASQSRPIHPATASSSPRPKPAIAASASRLSLASEPPFALP